MYIYIYTGELVELNGVIDGTGGEASGIGAKSQGGDAVTVVAEDPGSGGGEKRVVNGDGHVG